MEKLEKSRNQIHGEVIATYSVFETAGEKYFQIDTYGSINREMPEKISQSVQVNERSAELLIELLKSEFKL